MNTTLSHIPIRKAPVKILTVDAPNGRSVYIRTIRGVSLISRKDLTEYFASKHHVDRLVSDGYLTSYFPNGEVKRRCGGRMPGGETYYDWDEFLSDKYNEMQK